MPDLPAAIHEAERILRAYPDIAVQKTVIEPPNPESENILLSIPEADIPEELIRIFETTERCEFSWKDPSGTVFGKELRYGGFTLLSPSEIKQRLHDLREIAREAPEKGWNEDDPGYAALVQDWPHWLPVFAFDNGDCFCINMRDKSFPVVFLEHDVMVDGPNLHGLKIAPDLKTLIDQWSRILFVECDWSHVTNESGINPWSVHLRAFELAIYGKQETAFMDLVDRYCSVPEAERDEIRKKWADGDPFELSGDWWKLTSKHEKYSSARRIRAALIYISIGEPQKKEFREWLISLATIYHSCLIAGLDPDAEFEYAAVRSTPVTAEFLRDFLKRSDHNKSLEAFWLKRCKNANGNFEIVFSPEMEQKINRRKIVFDAAILLCFPGFCLWVPSLSMLPIVGKMALIAGSIWSIVGFLYLIAAIARHRTGEKYLSLFQWLDLIKRKMRRSAERKDISLFLKKYTRDGYPADTVKPVVCPQCGGDVFEAFYANDCGDVKCCKCGHQRFLLDSKEYWDGKRIQFSCPKCGNLKVRLWIGLAHRDTGDIKWIYVVFRCPSCGALDCMMERKINYEPTDEMEKNIYNPDWEK